MAINSSGYKKKLNITISVPKCFFASNNLYKGESVMALQH